MQLVNASLTKQMRLLVEIARKNNIPVIITIEDNKEEFTLTYNIAIAAISESTEVLLNKIRDELITKSAVSSPAFVLTT